MAMPGFTAETSLYRTSTAYHTASAAGAAAGGGAILPQQSFCVSSSCYTIGGGRLCVTLPVFGRRCVNVPRFGRWRIRCCPRIGWPPVSCSIQGC